MFTLLGCGSSNNATVMKCFLLASHAALYLAQEAHYEYNLTSAPTGRTEIIHKHDPSTATLDKTLQACWLEKIMSTCHWSDMIIESKMLEGDGDEDSYNYPTARHCYDVLLDAMAGVGRKMRTSVGLPRRPHVVAMSYRLRACFEELKGLLSKVNVSCGHDSEESLRFACANNQTDFETGVLPQEEQTLVGQ